MRTGNPNLSRDEVRARSSAIAVRDLRVELDLRGAPDPATATFASVTTLRFVSTVDVTWVDLLAPRVRSITCNGWELDPVDVHDGARIHLPDLVDDATTVNEVRVVADVAWSSSGEGMHRFLDPVDGETYCYTQFEPADARHVFACFEQPDVRVPVTMAVLAPDGWEVRSNTAGQARPAAGGTRWDFAPTRPIASYLVCVVAGPFHVVDDHWSGRAIDGTALEVPLALLCRASLADALDPGELFSLTHRGLDFFHGVFERPFPFGHYVQAFVPEYNLGAMENPGLVTLTESYVFQSTVTDAERAARATTMLHEMAHMWFGDLVAIRWWDDLWLKESFADFMGTLATSEATSFRLAWTAFANGRKVRAVRADQLPSTHPIAADIRDLEAAKLHFDGITYSKGASVLKQLVAWVGREAFLAGVNRYFDTHAWGVTSHGDFLAALEAESGRDLSSWSRAWLESTGVSTLRIEVETARRARDREPGRPPAPVVAARVVQAGVDSVTGRPIDRPHRVGVGGYDVVNDELVRTWQDFVDLATPSADLPGLLGRPRPALLLANDEDLTYAKVVLDETSMVAVRSWLGTLADPLARALVWSALWNATRDSRLPAADFLDIVARHGPAETHPGVLRSLHGQARTAIERHAPGWQRADLRDRTWRVAVEATTTSSLGSDRRLAWLRLATSLSAGRPTWLRDLLRGRGVPVGVDLDPDLAWAMWIELAATDHVSPHELDRVLASDDRAVTRRWRETARAARPTIEAKEAGWTMATERDDVPNEVLDAVLAGWGRPDQRRLTEPFEGAWLADLESWWSRRSIGMARRLVRGLAPSARDAIPGVRACDHPTVRAMDGWLDDRPHAAPSLRRLVVEERDLLVRSLTSQATLPTWR